MKLEQLRSWEPPANWQQIHVIDAHTGGEPLRVYLDDFPDTRGETVLQRRADCLQRLDALRTATLWEPRGHADMYGCLIVPAEREDSDFGVIFMHNQGYSDMCGHGIIAMAGLAPMLGLVRAVEGKNTIRIDAPPGRVTAYADMAEEEVKNAWFENVPSFVYERGLSVDVPDIGRVKVDVAFGGAFYAFVAAKDLGVRVTPEQVDRLVVLGDLIKHLVKDALPVKHPEVPELNELYGTIIVEDLKEARDGLETRNVCIFADRQIDRSPTGTGTSGACDGSFAQDLNALWSSAPAKNPGAGATVQAQLWYRDPLNTSNQQTSLSNAIEFGVCQ